MPHFTHALEWLLFTSLEVCRGREVDSRDVLKKSIALLSRSFRIISTSS